MTFKNKTLLNNSKFLASSKNNINATLSKANNELTRRDKINFAFLINNILKPRKGSFVKHILESTSIGTIDNLLNKDYYFLHYLDVPYPGSTWNVDLTISKSRLLESFILFANNHNLRESIQDINVSEFNIYYQDRKKLLIKLSLWSSDETINNITKPIVNNSFRFSNSSLI